MKMWKDSHEQELAIGYTLRGPHRDNFTILLKERPAAIYGSEGQKRTIIAALKLAECRQFERPLFGVDDFAVHLDPSRTELFLKRLHSVGQLFITSPQKLEGFSDPICIDQGSIKQHLKI